MSKATFKYEIYRQDLFGDEHDKEPGDGWEPFAATATGYVDKFGRDVHGEIIWWRKRETVIIHSGGPFEQVTCPHCGWTGDRDDAWTPVACVCPKCDEIF